MNPKNLYNPLYHPIIFTYPERLVGPDTWVEHIPFAMYLVDIVQPDVFVQLGIGQGNDYAAFCQAIHTLEIDARAYGITDSMTKEDVVNDLAQVYPKISTILKESFETALERFEDASISLLHITGMHDYATISDLFNTWLPKMKPDGVILIDNVDIRNDDSEIRKFWEKIEPSYETFEFYHANGLGVVALNERFNEGLEVLTNDRDLLSSFKTLFGVLGSRYTEVLSNDSDQILAELDAAKEELTLAKEKLQNSFSSLQQDAKEVIQKKAKPKSLLVKIMLSVYKFGCKIWHTITRLFR